MHRLIPSTTSIFWHLNIVLIIIRSLCGGGTSPPQWAVAEDRSICAAPVLSSGGLSLSNAPCLSSLQSLLPPNEMFLVLRRDITERTGLGPCILLYHEKITVIQTDQSP